MPLISQITTFHFCKFTRLSFEWKRRSYMLTFKSSRIFYKGLTLEKLHDTKL